MYMVTEICTLLLLRKFHFYLECVIVKKEYFKPAQYALRSLLLSHCNRPNFTAHFYTAKLRYLCDSSVL